MQKGEGSLDGATAENCVYYIINEELLHVF